MIEYIPLPPSPATWELDGRHQPQQDYKDPVVKEIFLSSRQKKYTKVLKLAAELDPKQLSEQVGEVVAKAYRDIIKKRIKANQLQPAARWTREMLDTVPVHCDGEDKRRLNKIIDRLDKENISHEFTRIDAPPLVEEPCFAMAEDSHFTIAEVSSLPMGERPKTAFELFAITRDGVLYIDRRGKSVAASGALGRLRKLPVISF